MLEVAKELSISFGDFHFEKLQDNFHKLIEELNVEILRHEEHGKMPVSLQMVKRMLGVFDEGMEEKKSAEFINFALISMTTAIKIYEEEEKLKKDDYERAVGRD